MGLGENPEEKPAPRKARRGRKANPPAKVTPPPRGPTPTERLDAMTESLVLELGADKAHYRRRCEELQTELDRLRPENARLLEMVHSAQILDFVSLFLITLGGGLLGYAAFFAEPVNHQLAAGGLGAIASGVLISLVVNVYRVTR